MPLSYADDAFHYEASVLNKVESTLGDDLYNYADRYGDNQEMLILKKNYGDGVIEIYEQTEAGTVLLFRTLTAKRIRMKVNTYAQALI